MREFWKYVQLWICFSVYKKKVDYEAQESKYVKEAMTKFQGGDLKQCAKTMNKEA